MNETFSAPNFRVTVGPPGQIETLAKRHLSEPPRRVLTVLGYFACPKAVKNWRSAQSNNDNGIINKLFASDHQDPAVWKKRRRVAIAGGVHATGVGAIEISGRSVDRPAFDLQTSLSGKRSRKEGLPFCRFYLIAF
jgi:hypothetical protein